MSFDKFINMPKPPREDELTEALGPAKALWDDMKNHLRENYRDLSEEWKKSGPKYSWGLRLASKKKVLVYLIPDNQYFRAAFVLGRGAVEAVRKSDLPRAIIADVEAARQYAEGRPLRLDIKKTADLKLAKKIAAVKMAN